ncbi:Hsp20/alpha crystallin family protein [Melaminivora sp.]|uniref:Hsp20/alpha crystallin family protein n=1 Tax=Melaminivora sp. TaxID=1933032 RepID=UPI0028A8C518|nr:Hsp20/alpha crystallin family protein [Melaminivora sp.]
MIFAPVIRRAAVATPHAADLALQRFLQSTVSAQAGVRLEQDDKTITLNLDVPGLAREQLAITIEGARVSVASIEGAPRRVRRSWEFAQEIDAAASSARLEHGVLSLSLAKVLPESRAVTLAIQ